MSSERDELVLAQKDAIDKEIAESQALISGLSDFAPLAAEYAENQPFLLGIQNLQKRYKHLRRVRGDGNCFYRAFLFAYLETLFQDPQELARMTDKIKHSKDQLVSLGYNEIAIDTFWEAFVEHLQSFEAKTHQELEAEFTKEDGDSNYLVWYCRLLTSGYLKANGERFLPFIDGLCPGMSVEQFCAAEVEPMNKECEQVQVIALAESLEVGVKIEYLDGRIAPGQDLRSYICPEGATPRVCLLYRPGHYDILYQ